VQSFGAITTNCTEHLPSTRAAIENAESLFSTHARNKTKSEQASGRCGAQVSMALFGVRAAHSLTSHWIANFPWQSKWSLLLSPLIKLSRRRCRRRCHHCRRRRRFSAAVTRRLPNFGLSARAREMCVCDVCARFQWATCAPHYHVTRCATDKLSFFCALDTPNDHFAEKRFCAKRILIAQLPLFAKRVQVCLLFLRLRHKFRGMELITIKNIIYFRECY